ncbi:hypothetical protein CYMTET_10538 [Cymbomonas tetramitiformis]|uniref:Uncharacterized protein n=1 Tax=Cymbomonas tetramitiformis TaxID=36881 RepID=A0AAE0GP10_9CHLO|nr:hypothetical protein CYMTET_10538 [Cymbomonas tetramitiformis]
MVYLPVKWQVKLRKSRLDEYAEAIEWCKEHNKGAKAAVSTGLFPRGKATCLHQRLVGKVQNDAMHASAHALTPDEERSLSKFMTLKNFCGDGEGREFMDTQIVHILKARRLVNRKGGRRNIPLSPAAHKILRNGKPGRHFYARFFAKHSELTEKRYSSIELARAAWLTREVSLNYFEKLKVELLEYGIMDAEGNIDLSRIITSDEAPNPLCETLKGHYGKIVCGTGQSSRKKKAVNKERISLDAYVGLDGHFYDPHLIVKCDEVHKSLFPDMGPDCDVLLSPQKNAFQDQTTLFAALQHLDKQATARGIKRPFIWLTDGQSARFTLKKQHPNKAVTKPVFAAVFPQAWHAFTKGVKVDRVAAKVGITAKGLRPHNIDDSFFPKSNAQRALKEIEESEQDIVLPTPDIAECKTRTQYLERENELLKEKLREALTSPLTPEEAGACRLLGEPIKFPELEPAQRKKPQVSGSMTRNKMIEVLEAAEWDEIFQACESEVQRQEKADERAAREAEIERVRQERHQQRQSDREAREAAAASARAERERVAAERLQARNEKRAEVEARKRERERKAQEKRDELDARKRLRVQGSEAESARNPLVDVTNASE